jgi:hypothetical protein
MLTAAASTRQAIHHCNDLVISYVFSTNIYAAGTDRSEKEHARRCVVITSWTPLS